MRTSLAIGGDIVTVMQADFNILSELGRPLIRIGVKAWHSFTYTALQFLYLLLILFVLVKPYPYDSLYAGP